MGGRLVVAGDLVKLPGRGEPVPPPSAAPAPFRSGAGEAMVTYPAMVEVGGSTQHYAQPVELPRGAGWAPICGARVGQLTDQAPAGVALVDCPRCAAYARYAAGVAGAN